MRRALFKIKRDIAVYRTISRDISNLATLNRIYLCCAVKNSKQMGLRNNLHENVHKTVILKNDILLTLT